MSLDRFITAQNFVYPQVLAELLAGEKRTHWMWFVFPQLRGLGHSERATRFGIADLDEARAYLAHHLLGPRLIECTNAVLTYPEKSAHGIFGSPDDLKFHSSLTLFARASIVLSREAGEGDRRQAVEGAAAHTIFAQALATFFNGTEDPNTLALLPPLPSGERSAGTPRGPAG